MKEESNNKFRSILMPALVGSAVGAGIALLVAPQSGKETRKDLKRFAAKTRDQVVDVIDEGRELYEEGREVVARAVKSGRETFDEGAERIEKMMHKKERSLMAPIIASGVIGAGIALLLAPKSGKEVRKDIKRIAVKSRDKVVTAIDKGKALYLAGRKSIPEAMETGKKVFIHEEKKLRHAA